MRTRRAFFGPDAPQVRDGDLLELTSDPHSGTWVVTDVSSGERDGVAGNHVSYVRKA